MAAEKKTPVRLIRAWWGADDERHEPGEVVDMTLDDAKAALAAGFGERADPLPGA